MGQADAVLGRRMSDADGVWGNVETAVGFGDGAAFQMIDISDGVAQVTWRDLEVVVLVWHFIELLSVVGFVVANGVGEVEPRARRQGETPEIG